MGLMNLFRKDVGQELDRAAGWLASGDAVRALETAGRYTNHKEPGHRTRARELAEQARQALVQSSLQKAATAEAEGDFEDAADWMRAALHHVRDDGRRSELETRLRELERRAQASAAAAALHVPAVEEDDRDLDRADDGADDGETDGRFEPASPVPDEDDGPVDFGDPEAQYELLVDTLSDELAESYRGRSAEFRRAFLALNQGEPGAALPLLNQLVRSRPGDAVLHLERGRCRLMLGEAHGARQDFEAAWEELGDAPISRDGSLTLPILWAEAALEDGDPGALLERLGDAAHPARGNGDLTALYADALIRTERWEEARPFLARAVETFPKRQDLPHALGRVLRQVGERKLAIQCLERAIAPSCASGSCSRPPLHLPSLRALTTLHLETAGEVLEGTGDGTAKEAAAAMERVDDLLRWIAGAQGGRMTAGDLEMVARYHELRGDSEAATRAREAARHAASGDGDEARTAPAPGDLAATTGDAIL